MNKAIIISVVVVFAGQSHVRASDNPQPPIQLPNQVLHVNARVVHEENGRHPAIITSVRCMKTCLCCVACVATAAAVPIGFMLVHLGNAHPEEFIK